MIQTSDAIHVVPIGDLREHDSNVRCWCKPSQDDEEPRLWIHHAMDRREEIENGEVPVQ